MDLHLNGQNALIVGGAKGIGGGIARAFKEEGANVIIWDRDPVGVEFAKELDQLPLHLNEANPQPHATRFQNVDVTNYSLVQESANSLANDVKSIDHIVFAVGIGSGKFGFPFWNLTPSDWPKIVEINLLTAVHVAHAFAPILCRQRSGTLTFISSVAGQIGSQTDPPYSAAKAGLINFAQCAAKDFAPYNVRVNTICPGMIKTQLNQSVWKAWHDQQPVEKQLSYDQWAGEKIKSVVPLGRWQTVEDVAALAVWLASSRAKNVTGQTMNVDGGFVMHW